MWFLSPKDGEMESISNYLASLTPSGQLVFLRQLKYIWSPWL